MCDEETMNEIDAIGIPPEVEMQLEDRVHKLIKKKKERDSDPHNMVMKKVMKE